MSNLWKSLDCADPAASDSAWTGLIKEAILPQKPGIYMWQLKFGVELDPNEGKTIFYEKLQNELKKGTGIIDSCAIVPSLHIVETRIGGGSLSEPKKRFLLDHYSKPNAIKNIKSFMSSLNSYAPIIYVGKAEDLQQRLLSHVQTGSDLSIYIKDRLQRDWRYLTLHYYELPEKNHGEYAAELIEALEMITQKALSPHGVKRQG